MPLNPPTTAVRQEGTGPYGCQLSQDKDSEETLLQILQSCGAQTSPPAQWQPELVRPPGEAMVMGLWGLQGGPMWRPRWCPGSLWTPGPPWPSEAVRAGECACLGDLGRVLGRGGELGL